MNRLLQIFNNLHLPGQQAHRAMMPEGRRGVSAITAAKTTQSAVLLLVFPHQGENHLVFIKRATYAGVHSGQIAFPGGRFETTDESLEQTAIRETREEIGLNDPVEILGRMSELYVPPSGFIIYPFVGWCHEKPSFVPDSREVELVFTEKLSHLISPKSREVYYFSHHGKALSAPCFTSNGYPIWGATAMILNEFLVVLQDNHYF